MTTKKRDNRRQILVRNNPGIYKIYKGKRDTGKFLPTRRTKVNGRVLREKAVFSNIADAKDFRMGNIDKKESVDIAHRNSASPERSNDGIPFSELVHEWKEFYFLTLERSSRQFYERKLPYLSALNDFAVDTINVKTIDQMVKDWVNDWPKSKSRICFDKELTLLKVILNFYRSRYNRAFVIPVEKFHYEASKIVRKGKGQVAALSESELQCFLEDLQKQSNPHYFLLAASQFGLSLRIGEACGLDKRYIDIDNKKVDIAQVVCWNDRTWDAYIKHYPKNDYIRSLSIPDFLCELYERWIVESDSSISLMFHNSGKLLNRKTIATAYNRSLKRIGVTTVSGTQMLRRTSATLANELTGDFFAVSSQLDHSSPEITKRYVKRVSSQKVKVANALNKVGKRILVPNGPHGSLVWFFLFNFGSTRMGVGKEWKRGTLRFIRLSYY